MRTLKRITISFAKRIRTLAFFAILIPSTAWTSDPTWEDFKLSQYVTQRWDVRNGLHLNSVNTIARTRDGFLWIGTQEGLIRFDGFEFTVFDTLNTPLLDSNHVQTLEPNGDGGLWIGMLGGGVVYWEHGEFSKPFEDKRLAADEVTCLLAYGPEHLYIGTETQGLFRFNGEKVERLVGPFEGRGITDLAMRKEGGLLVGTQGEGLLIFDKGSFRNVPLGDRTLAKFITKIKYLPSRGYLVGTHGAGLFLLNQKGFESVSYWPEIPDRNIIRSVCVGENGEFWWGTSAGIARASGDQVDYFLPISNEESHHADAMFFDEEQNLWVGLSGAGLQRFFKGSFTAYTIEEGMPDDMTWVVTNAPDGSVFVGTDDGGASFIKRGRISQNGIPERFQKGLINSAAFDSKGHLWIGKYNGLYRVASGKVDHVGTEKGLSALIYPVFADSKDSIWVGSKDAVWRIEPLEEGVEVKEIFKAENVYAIEELANGNLWFGINQGLALVSGDQVTRFSVGPTGGDIVALLADGDGLWVSDDKLGLGWFEKGVFQFVSIKGLPREIPYNILDDSFGYLWFSCNKGIYRIAKKQLVHHLDGKRESVNWDYFGQAQGLASAEGNLGGLPTATKDSGGRLWFTTVKGVVMVDPGEMPRQRPPPEPYISSVKVDQKPLPVGASISLPSQFKTLDIEFGAKEFYDPEGTVFKAELAGVRSRKDALPHGLRSAHYTQLPPGKKRFTVSVGNASRGFRHTTIELVVPKPDYYFWQQYKIETAAVLAWLGLIGLWWGLRHKEKTVEETQSSLNSLKNQESAKRFLLDRTANRLERAGVAAKEAVITTHFLHNVGNILNSVSVSSGLMEKRLRNKDKEALLKRIQGLLEEHKSNLTAFLQTDPRGVRLEAAFEEIAGILAEGKEDLCSELANLQLQCAHIQDIAKGVESKDKSLEPCHLALLVEDALKLQGYLLSKFSIDVENLLENGVFVLARRAQLLQIFVNLIKNAAESMSERPSELPRILTLVAHEENGQICLEISDTGIGIAPELQNKLFQKGFTTKKHGHGLGLSFCRMLMEEMNGSVEVYSAGEGFGATFRLIFSGHRS